MKNKFLAGSILIPTLILLFAMFFPSGSVSAEAVDPMSIISEVNVLRASYGLSALEVDSILMGTAQSTANIMAASSSCYHIGGVKDRIAAAGFGSGSNIFATENIACGAYMTTEKIIYEYWADAAHMIPMQDGNYTHVGAAVAEVNGYYYYVLHAAYVSGGSYTTSLQSTTTTSQGGSSTGNSAVLVTTSTPNENGAVIHVVQSGQTAWSISVAYNTTTDEIVRLNNLASAENPVIYIGQELLIQEAFTPTISPTVTSTLREPSRTPWPTVTPKPIGWEATITATPTPTSPPLLPEIPSLNSMNRQSIGIIILGICLVGLFVVLYTSIKSNKS